MKKILIVIVLLVLALVGYRVFQDNQTPIQATINNGTSNSNISNSSTPTSKSDAEWFDDISDTSMTYVETDGSNAASSFRCDGRKHCSQMTSCAEATYFIQNCPDTKMDGNRDGVPCEQQWC